MNAGFLTNLADEKVDRARVTLQETLGQIDLDFSHYEDQISKVISDLVSLMEQGHPIDVGKFLSGMLADERGTISEQSDLERSASVTMRRLSKANPEALPFLNEALTSLLGRMDRLATFYRDARWRLMESRAQFSPSEGKGPVHGNPADIDAYLKRSCKWLAGGWVKITTAARPRA